jgi:hypothetical protein
MYLAGGSQSAIHKSPHSTGTCSSSHVRPLNMHAMDVPGTCHLFCRVRASPLKPHQHPDSDLHSPGCGQVGADQSPGRQKSRPTAALGGAKASQTGCCGNGVWAGTSGPGLHEQGPRFKPGDQALIALAGCLAVRGCSGQPPVSAGAGLALPPKPD